LAHVTADDQHLRSAAVRPNARFDSKLISADARECGNGFVCAATDTVEKYIMQEKIEAGFQTFTSDGSEEFGAVHHVSPGGRPELVIYVENAGDFTVPLSAVDAVHSEKVILNCAKLDRRLRHAIGHAHDGEEPGA
jgi:hypothetical protein